MRRLTLMLAACTLSTGCLDLNPAAYTFDAGHPVVDAGLSGTDCPHACTSPPARRCLDATTLEAFPTQGRCAAQGGCGYNAVSVACANGCANGACTGDPCAGRFCDAPPAPTCGDATHLRVSAPSGACDHGSCAYATQVVECPGGCRDGACVGDACTGRRCTTPPPSQCLDDHSLRLFVTPGACAEGQCAYSTAELTCAHGCSEGACTNDPCASLACATPPAPTCSGASTRRSYGLQGTCTAGACHYQPTDTACPAGQQCNSGTCVTPSVTCMMSCASGCCEADVCRPPATQDHSHCGFGAQLCGACAPGDECASGRCRASDLCSVANGGCSANATCSSGTATSRVCTCNSGYTGDGLTCDVAPGSALVSWVFPDGHGCADAVTSEGINSVELLLDTVSHGISPCSSGLTGVTLSGLMPGSHSLELRASGASAFQYFGAKTQLIVTAGATAKAAVPLSYVVGGFSVKWRFSAGANKFTCAQMTNPRVWVNFKDSSGAFVYPDAGASVPCLNGNSVQGTTFPYLPAGTYSLYIQTVGYAGFLFVSDQLTPPVVVVAAGDFPSLTTAPIIDVVVK